MKFKKDIRKYIILSGIFFLLIISFFVLATALIRKPGVQQYVLQKVCIGYGLETRTGEMELDIFGASGVAIHDVEICTKDKSCSVTASSMTINFSKLRLLMGELIPVSVDIKHPVIEISETYARSLVNKKNGAGRRMPILCRGGVNRFNIEDGELLVTGPSGIAADNLSAKLEHVKETSNTYRISGSGKITCKDNRSEFNIKSTIDVNPDDILKSVFSASLKTENTPLVWIPESSKKLEFNKGLVNSDLNIFGDPAQGMSLGGTLKFKSAGFTITHRGRSKIYNIPSLNCNLGASMKDQEIRIDSLNMKNPDLNIDLDMIINLTNRDDPYFKMSAKSKYMSIHTFRDNFPFPVTKSWLEDTLFPMFEDGMVRMDKLVLDGRIDQFRRMREKENHSVLDMHLTCKSFILSNIGIRVPFTEVAAQVDISDGNLEISRLKGVFGDSEIKEGSLHVDGMAAGNPLFTIFVDGDFDIRELMSHREIIVVPETARERIEKYRELDGRLSAGVIIEYHRDWDSPRILSGDFSFRDTIYHKRPLGLPLRFTQMDFHFLEDGDNSFSGQGSFGNTRFGVTGITELSGSSILIKHAEIAADTDMTQLIQRCLNPDRHRFKFRESLPLDVTIDRQEEAFAYRGSLDAERLVAESENIIYHAAGKGNSVAFDLLQQGSGKLDINKVQIRLGNSNILLSGEYNLEDEKLNALKITSGDLSIGDLGIGFKGTENVLSGRLNGSLDFDFPGKNIKGMQINGNLMGDSISFIPGFLPLPVSGCSFRLDLSGKKGFINQLDMKFGEHPVHIKGILHGWDTVKGDLLATADYFDLTEIILNNHEVSAGKNKFHEKAFFREYEINLKLNASRGIWRKLEFKRLNADIDISYKNIKINNAQAELDTGDAAVSGTLGRRESGKVDIDGRINLDKQPVDKLISDTGFGDRGIKGTLSLNASVNIEGPVENGLLRNLSGEIDRMLITKGLIKNSRVFLKILDGLNIPDKFRERPEDMREEGFYFHAVEGTGVIEKGILKTDEFIIKSPAFNAVGSGEENLYKQTHKIRLLLQPLTNLDYIISKIPVVGPIFSDDNETIFTVGYDVKGPWSKPDLDLVPGENLKSMWGVLKRAVRTPIRLIENLSNGSKKSTKKTEPEVTAGDKSTEDRSSTEEEKP